MAAIEISTTGECLPVQIKQTKRGCVLQRKQLYLHHVVKEHNIALMSPVDPRALEVPTTAIFDFQLPPPLNAYVYPTPLIALRMVDEKLIDMTPNEFMEICHNLGTMATTPEETAAVYDVPAIPLVFSDDEDFGDDSEEEDLDCDESEGEDMGDLEDDEDWEIEEDDISTV